MGGKVAKPQSQLAARDGRSAAAEQGAGEKEAPLTERGASVGEKESPGEKHGRAGGSRLASSGSLVHGYLRCMFCCEPARH